MKILNLYAGIGGNRKLWGNEHEITAIEINPEIAEVYKSYFPNDKVIIADAHQYLLEHFKEYDFIWSSFPCQTHSKSRFWAFGNSKPTYPDLGLQQEILFLKYYFKGLYLVENVRPYYNIFINPEYDIDRHLYWCNFHIKKFKSNKELITEGSKDIWINHYGFDLSEFNISQRKDQIYRNCVHPETGLHILNCALNKAQDLKTQQLLLF